MAGFVSLVNSARAKIGKPPVGFLNKMLYDVGAKNTSIYNDVTEGHNKCCAAQGNKEPICCNTGFSSTPGWDPVVSKAAFLYCYCCYVCFTIVDPDIAYILPLLVRLVDLDYFPLAAHLFSSLDL
jgi:hypothetical protein